MANSRKISIITAILLISMITMAVNQTLFTKYQHRNRLNYLAAIVDKNQLLENTSSPKIIIVGGSNAAFGFDSKAISEATGMPVVNMGIQGSIGLRFPLNDIKPDIHEGDIILVSPEYHNLFAPLRGGDVLTDILVFDPSGIQSITSFNDAFQVLESFPHIHTEGIKNYIEVHLRSTCDFLCKVSERVYYRGAFDAGTGDITTNKAKNSDKNDKFFFGFDWTVPNWDLNQSIRFLNSFNDYVVSKGAKMYFVYPSISNNYTDETGKLLDATQLFLTNHLEFPILGTLTDSAFASEYMFDTPYHLNDVGREIRTKTVIRDLCLELENGCKQ